MATGSHHRVPGHQPEGGDQPTWQEERTISTITKPAAWLSANELRQLAQAQLDGLASAEDLALLEEREDDWVEALRYLHREVEATIERVERNVRGPERGLVLSDFDEERRRIEDMLRTLGTEVAERPEEATAPREQQEAPAEEQPQEPDEPAVPPPPKGVAQLQLSWEQGQLVAWAAGDEVDPESADAVLERLRAAGASTGSWSAHDPVRIPGGARAEAVAAPVQTTLGWLVGIETEEGDQSVAPSPRWLGSAAALAVRLVAQGRMVPQLKRVADEGQGKGKGNGGGARASFAVRWEPTLIDHDELSALARSMPGTVAVLEQQRDPRAVARTVVAGFVDAICRNAAGRVEVPAPPPQPRNASDVAETVLARLDGSTFDAPAQFGTEISRGLHTWARGVTGAAKLALTLQLSPPDDAGAWHLRTLASDGQREKDSVEAAMSRASNARKETIKRELERLEGLYEPLMRSKGKRRGQVILSQDEAWDLMTTTGPTLVAAGFEVQVPPLSRRKPAPSLRVTSTGDGETAVGAQQLTAVRWSAVFDDVELTAEEINRLAGESRPLVKSHGRWVEVNHADLEAAAAALAERADRNRLTGAEMLRYALGLEDSALGGVTLGGDGWAADLLRSAAEIPEQPPTRPTGFSGELRAYQADALAWLGFLDSAGLGGCLALDMGLGKTPTVLAHLRNATERGPALVIAPPAVVGNWASEAARFVPDLNVVVHHGTDRVDEGDIEEAAATADLLITTYATAVRDIDGLAGVPWGNVVLDEAQVIKNPASETAQQLRRLGAHTRLVLTGTPIENGLGDLWALLDFVNPGLVGDRAQFIAQLSANGSGRRGSNAESALRTLNGVLVFRRTKAEPVIAEELPDRIDELAHCPMTPEQVGLYQAVLDELVRDTDAEETPKKGAVLAAITALKQICNHPAAYTGDDGPLDGRSGKLGRLEEIVDNVFEAGERMLIFTHFATWGERLAKHLTARTGVPVPCYHGGLSRGARDEMVRQFQAGEGAGALVLSLKAGGTGLNLTAAGHVVLYDRWWNPAVEDQARDRVWRIGQTKTVVCHRLVCPGTVDERVEEVVAGKRRIADLTLPKSSSVGDLGGDQLRRALGIDSELLLTDETNEEMEGAAA